VRSTYRTPGDVTRTLDLPVLAAVPAMLTAQERHQRRRRRRVLWSIVLVTVALVLGLIGVVYQVFQ